MTSHKQWPASCDAAVGRLDLLNDLMATIARCAREQRWTPRLQGAAAKLAADLEDLAGDFDKATNPLVAVDLVHQAKNSLGVLFASLGDAVADDLALSFRLRRRKRSAQGRLAETATAE